MALTTLLKAIKAILEILQNLEISHLSVDMTNIIIWVPLSFSHYYACFSQMV